MAAKTSGARAAVVGGLYSKNAPRYLEAGYFPLPSSVSDDGTNLKRSMVKGFTGLKDAVPTVDEITEWSSRYPERNVCLRLPRGVVGIDVDDYEGKAGGAALDEWQATAGAVLPPTFVCTSRGGQTRAGVRLYRVTMPIHSNGIVCKDVELIDFHHRVMCAPPSLHPITGQEYRFYSPDGSVFTGVPAVSDLPVLPEPLQVALSNQGPQVAGFTADSSRSPALPADQLTPARARFLIRQSNPGERHNVARSALLSAENHRARGRDVDPFVQTLRDEFVTVIGDARGSRDAAAREFDGMLSTAQTKATSQPFGPIGSFGGPSTAQQPSPSTVVQGPSFPRRSLSERANAYGFAPEPQLLVRSDGRAGVYARGVSSIIGAPESMKTFICLQMAKETMKNGAPVVYIDLEDTPASLQRRLDMLGVERDVQDGLFVYRDVQDFTPTLVEAEERGLTFAGKLAAYLRTDEATTAGLVVVDTLPALTALLDVHTYSDGSEYSKLFQNVFQPIGERTAVVLIDHTAISDEVQRKPLGVTAKVSTVKGVSLSTHVVSTPTVDSPLGVVELYVAKDNTGMVRRQSQQTRKGELFARVSVAFNDSEDLPPEACVTVSAPGQADTADAPVAHGLPAGEGRSLRQPATERRTLLPIPGDLDADEFAVLQVLRQSALPQTLNQLAAQARRSKPKVKSAVARLVEAGVVDQAEGPRGARLHRAL